MPLPSERDFTLFQRLIREQAGIYLTASKKDLLVARLQKRVRELGVPSFGAYYARVVDDEDERIRMLDCICTNETHFFREPRQFDVPRAAGAAATAARGRERPARPRSCGCGAPVARPARSRTRWP